MHLSRAEATGDISILPKGVFTHQPERRDPQNEIQKIHPPQGDILRKSHIHFISSFTSSESLSSLSQSFATFSSEKIHKLHTSLLNHACSFPHISPPGTPPNFFCFNHSPSMKSLNYYTILLKLIVTRIYYAHFSHKTMYVRQF